MIFLLLAAIAYCQQQELEIKNGILTLFVDTTKQGTSSNLDNEFE